MTVEAAIMVGAFVVITTVIVLAAVVTNRKNAAREEELKQKSAMRGWTFEASKHRGDDVQKWTGITEFVEWTVESHYRPGGRHRDADHSARWQAQAVRGPEAPILCMAFPPGKEIPAEGLAQGESWVAKLAQKAVGFALDKAVDAYFGDDIGKEIDAAALKPVPGDKVPGHAVMALDPDAAARVLSNGLARVLAGEATNPNRKSEDKMPWVLLWKGGVTLAQNSAIDTVEDLERLARLGAAIAKLPIA